MPKKVLWMIAALLAGVLVVTFKAERYPARVVVINQSGVVATSVHVDTEMERFDIGTLRPGETRSLEVAPANRLQLSYRTDRDHRWALPEPLTPGKPLVLNITPTGQVDPRSGFGIGR